MRQNGLLNRIDLAVLAFKNTGIAKNCYLVMHIFFKLPNTIVIDRPAKEGTEWK